MARAAFLLSLIALGLSLALSVLYVAGSGPEGVCVTYDVDTVGTMVGAPKKIHGVLSCETGSFVSVDVR